MIGFLNSLFSLATNLIKILEKFRAKKQTQSEYELHNKASAYDKLQKAIKARNRALTSDSVDHIMSEDRFKRE